MGINVTANAEILSFPILRTLWKLPRSLTRRHTQISLVYVAPTSSLDVNVGTLIRQAVYSSVRMTQISDFPNELLLQIYPHLPLKGLLAAQGVCQKWRQLVTLSDIPTHRRAFYDFYMKLIQTPLFFRTRPWVLANLRPFDRQAFLNALLEQYPHLPEEFTLWILEWPSRAVIGCCWPGLPSNNKRYGVVMDPNSDEEVADNVEIREGQNFLGCMPPQVSALDKSESDDPDWVAVVQLWRDCNGSIWLVVDEREELFGKVLDTNFSGYIGDDYEIQYSGLLEWQKRIWSKIEFEFGNPLSRILPLIYSFNGRPRQWESWTPWSRRNEPVKWH